MADKEVPGSPTEGKELSTAPNAQEREAAARKIVIEVIEKGLLDLKRTGLLALVLSDAGAPRADCGCRIVCGCHDSCPALGDLEQILDKEKIRKK